MAATPAPAKAPEAPKPTILEAGYTAAFLNAHPDVKAKVALFVSQRWTTARLEAEIKTTAWWRTRTQAQRQADIDMTSNPKEFERQVQIKQADMLRMASAMGVDLSPEMAWQLAKNAHVNGSSDSEIQWTLASRFKLADTLRGQASLSADSLRQQAGDMGITLTDSALESHIQQMLGGRIDEQGFLDEMREQAKVLYAPIASALDRGVTVRQYLSPYLSIAEKELGIDGNTVDLTDSKWTKAIQGQDGTAPMTADDWTKTIRQDKQYQWGKGSVAQGIGANAVTNLSKMFGGYQ